MKAPPKPRYSKEEQFIRARDRFWKAALAYGLVLEEQRPDLVADLQEDLHDLAEAEQQEHLAATA